jgi:hypothetical protein
MKFRDEFKWAVFLIITGSSLIGYAQMNFSSKDAQEKLEQDVKEMSKEVAKKEDLQRIWTKLDGIETYLRKGN